MVVVVAILAIALIGFVAIAGLGSSGNGGERTPAPGAPLPTIIPSILPGTGGEASARIREASEGSRMPGIQRATWAWA